MVAFDTVLDLEEVEERDELEVEVLVRIWKLLRNRGLIRKGSRTVLLESSLCGWRNILGGARKRIPINFVVVVAAVVVVVVTTLCCESLTELR